MGMSDCPKCWETPCVCGYGYRDWDRTRIQNQIKMLQGILDSREVKDPTPPKPVISHIPKELKAKMSTPYGSFEDNLNKVFYNK